MPASTILVSPPDSRNLTRGEGKFLQLVLCGREHLLFAPTTLHRYHNELLAHFLQDNAVAQRWAGKGELKVEEPELAALGGGR